MGRHSLDPSRTPGGSADGKMYGKLGSVSLNDILQLLGMTQRTATVRLTWNGQKGLIYFREGELLHATAGSAEGERALVKLMSWESADFVVEEGLEGSPPATISKKVDAAMLDLMTRLDEGWMPEMTPFPMLDRVTTSAAVLDARSRASSLGRRPPRPRRVPRKKKPIAAAVAAALVVALASIVAIAQQSVDLGALPAISTVSMPHPPAAPQMEVSGIASDVLRASLSGRRGDSVVLLEAYGVALSPISESERSRNEPPVGDAAQASLASIGDAASRAPELGQLLVVAEPWAAVAVDGVDKGETPLPEMRLPAGSHEIVLSNPSFVGVIRDQVQIVGGETIHRKYSFGDSGSLRILVRPWADVFVDGRFAGQTPLGALRVPPGKHTIVLRHPELGEKTAVVEVLRNLESLLEVEM